MLRFWQRPDTSCVRVLLLTCVPGCLMHMCLCHATNRAAYVQQQRLAAAKTARASSEQLQAALDRAKKEAEEANAKLGK